MNKKNIPRRNYLYLLLIFLITVGVVYYLYLWFVTYKEVKFSSNLTKYFQVINYNELEEYIIENEDVYIYVSSLTDDEIHYEKQLEKKLRLYALKNKVLYLDITNNIDNNKYSINNVNFFATPMILYFSNGELISSYNIKNSNFNADKTIKYLESIGVVEK